MTTIEDLLKAQQVTDYLITRAFMAEAGYTLGKKFHPTEHQITLLYRWQTDSNQRLEALVERMEAKNAANKEGRKSAGAWGDDRADPGIRTQDGT